MSKISPAEIEARQKVFALIMVALSIIAAIIIIAQLVFWVAVVAFFMMILYLIVSFFFDFDLFLIENYGFDKLLTISLIIVLWVVAHVSFMVGYSPTSQEILKFVGQINELQGLPLQITLEAINDACANTPLPSCEHLKSTLELTSSVENVGNTAKFMQKIFNINVKVPTSV